MSTPDHPDPGAAGPPAPDAGLDPAPDAAPDSTPAGAWGEGPVASTPWSPDFLAQTLELLIVTLVAGGVSAIRPIHAPSIQVGWAPGSPADAVLGDTLHRYGLVARVLHSTSWRHDGEHVVLTYLAVVDPPSGLNPNLTSEPAMRVDLARGSATTAPTSIETSHVLEHALRHLAWLVADDAAVAASLPEWGPALQAYVPEPFRQL
jgi:hypothetical protein